MPSQNDDLGQRLQRLEDLEAIRQLFVDYGHHLDEGDFAAYAELYADDGEMLLGPLGRAKGRKDIEAVMTKQLGGQVGKFIHVVANPIISLEGDEAQSTVTWVVITPDANGAPVVSMIGRHLDRLVREKGRWRFLRRKGQITMPAKLPGA